MVQKETAMFRALFADGPDPAMADELMLYGRFVGSWCGHAVHHDAGGVEAPCEVHFAWVLAGRAIQDVWITPSRSVRGEVEVPPHGSWYGSTMRVYDPRRKLWHIQWTDPATQFIARMEGRSEGDEIVQEYSTSRGLLCQWRFTEITEDSFHWIRRESSDRGMTWEVKTEVFLRRTRGG